MILLPPNQLECPPGSCYEFESQGELRKYFFYANQNEILYTLYRDVKKFYIKDYFVDIGPRNTVLLTLYTITSCSSDKFATGHYVYNIGDNGSSNKSLSLSRIPGLDTGIYVSAEYGANSVSTWKLWKKAKVA